MEAPVQFCSCGSLLTDHPECGFCGEHNELQQKQIVIQKKFPGKKGWDKQTIQVERATVQMPCPKCNAKELYYSSRQTRSADEGETVFLECKKCGFKSVT